MDRNELKQRIKSLKPSERKKLLETIVYDCIFEGRKMMTSSEILDSVCDTLKEKGLDDGSEGESTPKPGEVKLKKYSVEISRSSRQAKCFEVEAENEEKAGELACERAEEEEDEGDWEYMDGGDEVTNIEEVT